MRFREDGISVWRSQKMVLQDSLSKCLSHLMDYDELNEDQVSAITKVVQGELMFSFAHFILENSVCPIPFSPYHHTDVCTRVWVVCCFSCATTAKDYALIMGLPGTGKTTTTSFLIRALHAFRKTVRICCFSCVLVPLLVRVFDSPWTPLWHSSSDSSDSVHAHSSGQRPAKAQGVWNQIPSFG